MRAGYYVTKFAVFTFGAHGFNVICVQDTTLQNLKCLLLGLRDLTLNP